MPASPPKIQFLPLEAPSPGKYRFLDSQITAGLHREMIQDPFRPDTGRSFADCPQQGHVRRLIYWVHLGNLHASDQYHLPRQTDGNRFRHVRAEYRKKKTQGRLSSFGTKVGQIWKAIHFLISVIKTMPASPPKIQFLPLEAPSPGKYRFLDSQITAGLHLPEYATTNLTQADRSPIVPNKTTREEIVLLGALSVVTGCDNIKIISLPRAWVKCANRGFFWSLTLGMAGLHPGSSCRPWGSGRDLRVQDRSRLVS
ncbi:hypothetical protein RRG08_013554 [Elysia crispata]|uniref:Uncharacterized protein n=1 Tax=Elysia crispata TaxID=231223 RepID=A0AAE0Y1P4_9GAST|nr:hypothetical protein RRG08_013554 [Elysia crispata]